MKTHPLSGRSTPSKPLTLFPFSNGPFLAKGTHGRNARLENLHLRAIRPRRQLHQRMQRHILPRTLVLQQVHKIRIDAPQHSLMRDDDDVLAPLQLHDDGLQADDDVAIRLAAAIAVIVLVLVARGKVLGVLRGDLLVGHAVADARVQLVEGLPFQLRVGVLRGGEEARGADRAAQRRRPDGEAAVVGQRAGDEVGQGARVVFAVGRQERVAANLLFEVVLRFAVLKGQVDGQFVSVKATRALRLSTGENIRERARLNEV